MMRWRCLHFYADILLKLGGTNLYCISTSAYFMCNAITDNVINKYVRNCTVLYFF